jgi:hypothetical protein
MKEDFIMRHRNRIVFLLIWLAEVGILAAPVAMAQNAAPPSLGDQLEAQYQLTKIEPGTQGATQPGTVLVIQKTGILGYPPGTARWKMTATHYKDGALHLPRIVMVPSADSTRPLPVGDKVYISNIEVDVKHEKIMLNIVECDACNGVAQPSSMWSAVAFEFAKGYLETASVPDVEDTIGQVLAVYTPPPEAPATPPVAAVGATPGQALTNDDIIQMVQVKLADSVIIAKIKSSACTFDTSTDALIKLKQAGLGDAVQQAMVEVAGQPPPPPPPPLTMPEASLSPGCGDYASCLNNGRASLNSSQWDQSVGYLQKASSLDPSEPDAWTELGRVYVATGHYQDAVAMWDKALGLGGTLVLPIWHWAGTHLDRGTFYFSAKEASFVGPGGGKIFSVAPTELSSVKSHKVFGGRGCWSFGMKVKGHQYWFSFVPGGVECSRPDRCGDPGNNQEEAVSNYVAQAIAKLAPGSLAK